MAAFYSICFIAITMTCGILIVYFALNKIPKPVCQRSFRMQITLMKTEDSGPRSVAFGDFNNDALLDMIVANYLGDNIGLFLGSDIDFYDNQTVFSTGVGSHPCSVAVGNLNNDTHLDIAAALYGTNSIILLFGDGNGTFPQRTIISLNSSRPRSLSVGHLNNDPYSDIVVSNDGTNTVLIFFGDSNSSFVKYTSYFTGYDSRPLFVRTIDLNNDTNSDILVAKYGTNEISIFYGDGNGTFFNEITYSCGSRSNPYSVNVADLNNDGYVDIVSANSGSDSITIFFGNHDGTFEQKRIYSTGPKSHPYDVNFVDMNGDKILDIVVANYESDILHMLIGDGTGAFQYENNFFLGTESRPSAVAVVYLNEDKGSSIIVVNSGTFQIALFRKLENKIFANRHDVDMYNFYINLFVVVDFNNDNILDLILVAEHKNKFFCYFGNGEGAFPSGYYYLSDLSVSYLVVNDLDNDGIKDIILAAADSDSIGIMYGAGEGRAYSEILYSTGLYPWSIAVADMNNDDFADIVIASYCEIGIFFGIDGLSFRSLVKMSTTNSCPLIIIIDYFDHDNYRDIVGINPQRGLLTFLYGRSNGTFSSPYSLTMPNGTDSNPLHISVGDFNNDQYLDVVVVNINAANFVLFLGDEKSTYSKQTIHTLDHILYRSSVTVGDFNGDHNLDVAIPNYASDSVFIYLGNGDGTFGSGIPFSTGPFSLPVATSSGDLNRDGILDLVVATGITDMLYIFMLKYSTGFATEKTYFTGSDFHPFGAVIADFNNDNHFDIGISYRTKSAFGIRLGLGNESFEVQTLYSVGIRTLPEFITTVDVNNDNISDIAITDASKNSVNVFLGDGTGKFQLNYVYPVGSQSSPVAAAFANLNRDNWVDMVVVNKDHDNVAVFAGYHYTRFDEIKQYRVLLENRTSDSVGLGDFNNDNHLDIVAVFNTKYTVGVFLGYDNGSFSDMIHTYVPSGFFLWEIDIGDFNNDGRLDVVVRYLVGSKFLLLLGHGNGSFFAPTTYDTAYGSLAAIIVGDFNNDHITDLAIAPSYAQPSVIFTYLGMHNDTFQQPLRTTFESNDLSYAAVGDFNNDGHLDIVVSTTREHPFITLCGHGNGTFYILRTNISEGTSFRSPIAAADFNRDNALDIVILVTGSEYMRLYLGYGNGSFRASYYDFIPGINERDTIAVADLNNDENPDICLCGIELHVIMVFFGYGDGTFGPLVSYHIIPNSIPNSIAIGDLNNDGLLDIVTNDNDENGRPAISILFATGISLFYNSITYNTGNNSQPIAISIVDLDQDNHMDIVIANKGTNNVGILYGYGDGSLENMVTYSTGTNSQPHFVTVKDINDDQKLDIIVANFNTENVAVFLGNGNRTLTNPSFFSTGFGSRPQSLTINDVNNDNQTDIIVADRGTNSIRILLGYSNGSFILNTTTSIGYNKLVNFITSADLNNDDWIDLVLASEGADDIQILWNKC